MFGKVVLREVLYILSGKIVQTANVDFLWCGVFCIWARVIIWSRCFVLCRRLIRLYIEVSAMLVKIVSS